jgi:L-threonine 3-dehydrogenase (EC 1.1.1.103)
MKKILITGATGQIGSELTLALRDRFGGENVVAAGHRRKPCGKLLESGPFVYLDATDRRALEKVVEEHDIDTIYHLAAVLSAAGEKTHRRLGGLTWKASTMFWRLRGRKGSLGFSGQVP